jgi:dTDP-4-amino-4,6-dideoxygalactose transaminase
MNYFDSKGISVAIHFPIPDHMQNIELKYRDLVLLPVTEKSCESLVTIPMFPEMLEHEIAAVCKSISELGI